MTMNSNGAVCEQELVTLSPIWATFDVQAPANCEAVPARLAGILYVWTKTRPISYSLRVFGHFRNPRGDDNVFHIAVAHQKGEAVYELRHGIAEYSQRRPRSAQRMGGALEGNRSSPTTIR